MHILFIDESGFIPKKEKTKDDHFLTLGGIVIPENIWFKVLEDINRIKSKYNIVGEIKWRYFFRGCKSDENSLSHLTDESKDILRNELYDIISSYKSIKLISAVTNIQKAYGEYWIKREEDIYLNSYKKIIERFQYYLQDLSREVGDKINGIVVCDPRGQKDDEVLRTWHHEMLNSSKKSHSSYSNLIEGLFFSPSHMSPGIQLADMVAGATHQQAKGKTAFFDKIRMNFRANNNGLIEGYGLVKWPKGKW